MSDKQVKPRVLKSAWFSKNANKAGISDEELCLAIKEMNAGQWDADLGGNVYKKRLNQNRHRSILLSQAGKLWIFTYLFAKADQDNISKKELKSFRNLADEIQNLSDAQMDAMKVNGDFVEICNDCKKEVQK
jgi:hypothetical protein